jgi:hypothetical protein
MKLKVEIDLDHPALVRGDGGVNYGELGRQFVCVERRLRKILKDGTQPSYSLTALTDLKGYAVGHLVLKEGE